jgi:4-hydroxyacetophenone monooxygenase
MTVNNQRLELLAASDAEIDESVTFTDTMALRGLIYQLTADEELAELKVEKVRVFFADAYAPADEDGAALIRRKAAAFLKSYRDAGAGPIGPGPRARLPKSLALSAGEELNADELPMWIEETAIDRWARKPEADVPPNPDFTVAVIGAGMGGLCAAVQLGKAGIPYFIIEKNSEVGGTWYENRYPGARVDTPSRAYTHIFGADFVFDYPFSPQEDNERYFNWVADHFGVREKIRFNTEVTTMDWDEVAQLWRIKTGAQNFTANAVICATGLLARPNLLSLPGMGDFKGPAFHTAGWPADLDVTGKRVAVIGTGATGYQLIPELAKLAGHVTVFQRKPQWIFAVPGYLSKLPPAVTWLDRNLPYHINFMRFRTNWLTGEHVYGDVFNLDPNWPGVNDKSALNREIRDARIAFIRESFAANPDMANAMIPPHPPFSARPILVDEAYNIYHAVQRDDVTLVTSGVERVTSNAVVAGGTEYPADVIVYATGFKANDLLWPMDIRGKAGVSISDIWSLDGCRAYTSGSMIPAFPNFFMLYGPNTNPANGGGIVNHEEMVTRFALECCARLINDGKRTVEVTQAGFDRFNALLDVREKGKIYTDPRAQNFFMNPHGRSSVMCPFAPSELWKMLKPLPDADLTFT